jgi:hypothetical protein
MDKVRNPSNSGCKHTHLYSCSFISVSSVVQLREEYNRVAQKSVNLKYYLVLTEMFRFKPTSQSVGRYHSTVSCALNMEDLISNSFFL